MKFDHSQKGLSQALGITTERLEALKKALNDSKMYKIETTSGGIEKVMELFKPKNPSELIYMGFLIGQALGVQDSLEKAHEVWHMLNDMHKEKSEKSMEERLDITRPFHKAIN